MALPRREMKRTVRLPCFSATVAHSKEVMNCVMKKADTITPVYEPNSAVSPMSKPVIARIQMRSHETKQRDDPLFTISTMNGVETLALKNSPRTAFGTKTLFSEAPQQTSIIDSQWITLSSGSWAME